MNFRDKLLVAGTRLLDLHELVGIISEDHNISMDEIMAAAAAAAARIRSGADIRLYIDSLDELYDESEGETHLADPCDSVAKLFDRIRAEVDQKRQKEADQQQEDIEQLMLQVAKLSQRHGIRLRVAVGND